VSIADPEEDMSWLEPSDPNVFTVPVYDGPLATELFWGTDYVPIGDSGFGASYHSVGMLCWRRYFFRNVENLVPQWTLEPGVSSKTYKMQRGLLMHHCHEVIMGGDKWRVPSWSREAVDRAYERLSWVAKASVYNKLVAECEKLLTAYLTEHWARDADTYEVISVEEPAFAKYSLDGSEVIFTVRWDARVRERRSGLMLVMEHKNFSAFGDSDRRAYLINLQTQAQHMIFQKTFPDVPFRGVMVNIAVATKVPRFHREMLVYPHWQMENFARQMHHHEKLKMMAAATDWPQNFCVCTIPFPNARGGICDYFSLCTGGIETNDIRGKAPPHGFVRKERLIRKEDLR